MERIKINHVKRQIEQLVRFGSLTAIERDGYFADLDKLDAALDAATDPLDVITQIASITFDTLPCLEDRKIIVVLPFGRKMPIDIIVPRSDADPIKYANRRDFLTP